MGKAVTVSWRSSGARLVAWLPVVAFFNFVELTQLWGIVSIRPTDVLFLVCSLLLALSILSNSRVNAFVLVVWGLLSIFSLLALAALVYDGTTASYLKTLRLIQTMTWGAFAAYFVRTEDEFSRIVRNTILAGAGVGVISIYLWATIPEVHRVAAFFTVAGGEGIEGQASFNEIGALSALSAALAISLALYKREGATWIHWLLLSAACAMGLILTQSRSALLSFVVAMCLILIPRIFGALSRLTLSRRDGATTIFLLGGGLGIVLFLEGAAAINRFADTFRPGSNAFESVVKRLAFWKEGVGYLATDPVFLMIGRGSTWLHELGLQTFESFYLDTAIAYGLIGLILVLALLVYPLIRASDCWRQRPWILVVAVIAATVALTVGMTGNVVVDPYYGGVTFLILCGAASVSRQFLRRREGLNYDTTDHTVP